MITFKKGKIKVSERPMKMKEALDLLQKNRVILNYRRRFNNPNLTSILNKIIQLLEMFGSGTACVVCPVEALLYKGEKFKIPTMDNGAPMMSRFSKELSDIQYGRTPNDWAPIVE